MNKPWRPNDYIKKLPEYPIRPMATPSVDLPRWFDGRAIILALKKEPV